MVGGTVEPTEWGTLQGSPLSPLLSNVLLDDLDKELEARGHRFTRYVDDLVILVKSKRAGRRVMAKISHYLTDKLKLKVNRDKSQVVKIEALNYLGFTFRGIRIFVSDRAMGDFKHRLRGLTSRSWGISMAYRLEQLNRYLRGWMNYFGISQHYSPVEELDGWLRRRIRMCYWKQWRRPRTRIANLLKLGTSKRHAILTGISRKGYWRLSKTLFYANGNDECMVGETGIAIYSSTLDDGSGLRLVHQCCLRVFMNRPRSDPHDGWCGRGGRNTLLDPIRVSNLRVAKFFDLSARLVT
jgi:RNA-directed DNA polymerase